VPVFERMPANSQAAVDAVFARCRADAACAAAFPQLDDEWQRLLAEVEAAPVTVGGLGNGGTLVLTAQLFATAVHQLLLSADTAAELPWVVHTLATAPDRVSAVREVAARVGDVLGGDGPVLVMQYATRCNEAWARFDPSAVLTDGRDSYYRDVALASARSWQQACAAFPRAGEAADVGPAAVVRSPVLIINGSADPQDPPASMAGVSQRWPESLQLVEPEQSHNVSRWACQETLIDVFIERGTVAGLPVDCLATVPPPRFVTS
jgi:hypothetical protein